MISLILICSLIPATICQKVGDASIVYQWASLEYDWPSPTVRDEFIKNGSFIVENNIITGIKLYKGKVYVTVPRWKTGVPSTLNVVVEKAGMTLLQPFPSWSMQRLGDCSAIQYSQSMEIDPSTGWMWIIDTGNARAGGGSQRLCPPKLVIYDIDAMKIIRTHVFPQDVASTSSFLNDIVLHKIGGKAALAYISDPNTVRIVVYDFRSDISFSYTDSSMFIEHGPSAVVHLNNKSYPQHTAIDGIAISPDFRYVYYCPLAGTTLYRIPTSVISTPFGVFSKSVQKVGIKKSQSDGLAFGQKNLYYGALSESAVYRWGDIEDSKPTSASGDVSMSTQVKMAQDVHHMKWVDTFGFDEAGYLWFTANNLASFMAGTMNFNQTEPNMYVWKMFVNEKGYLHTN